MKVGLNLFSLRNNIKTEADFLETVCRLREMGYAYLQFSGAPFDADRIARVSRAGGMPVHLTHVPMDRILHDTERLMEEHARFDCQCIGLGMMPLETILDEASCKKTIAALNAAAERMQKNGFQFFYHHHHYEFYRHGGETVFDYMIQNAPSIHFTADTYWLQYGGVSVGDFLTRLDGRIECVHLKDYRIAPDADGKGAKPCFAPVGDGTIDFAAAVAAAKRSGAKYFFVEQDNAPDFDDPFAQVERSVRFLEKEL